MTAADFFSWWKARLAELVPGRLRVSWTDAGTTLTLRVGGDRVELSAPPTREGVILESPTGGLGRPAGLDALLSRLPGPPQRIRLLVAPEAYLLREFTLPQAARSDLAETVRYQLPQLTPFAADRLLYACGEYPGAPGDGRLKAWLVAVPRRHVQGALELIGQAAPESPLRLRRPPPAGEALELSWRVAERANAPLRRRRLAWLGLIALWLAVPLVHLYQTREEQRRLDQTLATLRAEAMEVAGLRDRLDASRVRASWLAERRQSAVSVLTVMDRLSEMLDDRTWLQGLDLKGDRLTLRGLSSSPATVIETLEASRLLEDVRFDAAITRDGRGLGDRFNISARVASPGGDDGA